jgi:NhaP-type Na+/H+ or K+/H+ antiporter
MGVPFLASQETPVLVELVWRREWQLRLFGPGGEKRSDGGPMSAIVYVSVSLLAYALVQRRLAKTPITGPIVFVALGLLAGSSGLGIITVGDDQLVTVVNVLFQGTLLLLLFTDASALHFSSWKKDAALPGRLLGIGLPLTIGLGTIFAALLFTDLSIWEAAIIGAITAPTDAALGQAVISNPRVPERIRQALDIEAGLNDGVSFPFVLIFIGLAGATDGPGVVETFVVAIGVAVLHGVLVGVIGGKLMLMASNAGTMGKAWSGVAVIALAVTAFVLSDAMGGSGFIAAFVAGLAFGETTRGKLKSSELLATNLGLALVQVSFLVFGALILEPALGKMTWAVVVMAVLSLTIARMGPVAISMIGERLKLPTLLYMGWFGPRGLATIVFAALVVSDADLPGTDTITLVAASIVGLSVLLHGLTAYPGSQAYANWYESHDDPTKLAEGKAVHHHRLSPRARHTIDQETGNA